VSKRRAFRELASKYGPDSDEALDAQVRSHLRLDREALDALREICIRPGRNAMAQVAALRLRLEYSQGRPATEARVKLDPTGPLTVRFDLSGVTGSPPVVDAGERGTPPGTLPGGRGGAAAASAPTENFPLSSSSPPNESSESDGPVTPQGRFAFGPEDGPVREPEV
jgi:hypothetical protein